MFCFPSRGILLELMKEKKYLMELDVTLVKSWMCVLPAENLAEFVEEFSVDILISLQGVSYRLQNADPSCRKSEVCLFVASSGKE